MIFALSHRVQNRQILIYTVVLLLSAWQQIQEKVGEKQNEGEDGEKVRQNLKSKKWRAAGGLAGPLGWPADDTLLLGEY